MHLRFFISSPGDVGDERTFAQQVIEQELPKDPLLRGQITCEAMRWDDPNAPVAMPATLTPQEAVNRGLAKPSDCDATILILWARMGTPLPDAYKKPDGTGYLSGSEWEYEEALTAKQSHVLVYRRKTKPAIDPDDPAVQERIAQRQRVNQFFERFRNPDGSLKGGFAEYDTPQEFRDRLRLDLRAFIERRLKEKKPEAPAARLKAPPPYGAIAKALSTGRVIPLIGPDALRASGAAAQWDPAASKFLPSGLDLTRFLADDSGFPADHDRSQLAEVASYYEAFATRATLRARLRQVLEPETIGDVAIPELYRFLAELSTPLLIATTKYDSQLERAFRAVQKPYDLVAYPADRKDLANSVLWWPHGAEEPKTPTPNELDIDLSTTTVIFKMHGSIAQQTDAWDGFVITEEDYVEFLARISGKSAIPALFAAHFHDRSLLFLGYSLRDWNVRTMMRGLSRYYGRRGPDEDEIVSWAIGNEISELETKLWQKRGVYPYQVGVDELIQKLRAQMPK